MIAVLRAPLMLSLLLLAACHHEKNLSSTETTGALAAILAVSGNPPTDVTTGANYFYQPVVSTADSQVVSFSITGKPEWLNFDSSNGALSGTPTDAAVGNTGDIVIVASTASAVGSVGPFNIRVKKRTATTVPVISGSPVTSVVAGTNYSFTPNASNASGNPLTFQIQNKPTWASFSTSTGQLSGSPSGSNVGSYPNILISVSDGVASASLSAFTLTVNAAVAVTGTASLSWTPPTVNLDGTPLTDLAGYRIYYGNNPSALSSSITLNGSNSNSYLFSSLTAGTWYFTVRSFNAAGVESPNTATLSKTI